MVNDPEQGLKVVSSRCRIEKKEEKEREHKPEGTRGCTRPEVFGKDAMKKGDRNHPNSMQHGNYRIENLKISENMIKAQVRSVATAQQAMQSSRSERLLYDSCAQESLFFFVKKMILYAPSRNEMYDCIMSSNN